MSNKQEQDGLGRRHLRVHTPEPWTVRKIEDDERKGHGSRPLLDYRFEVTPENVYAETDAVPAFVICRVPLGSGEYLSFQEEANARRIAACVNACKGLTDEALAKGTLGEVLENTERLLDALRVEIGGMEARVMNEEAVGKIRNGIRALRGPDAGNWQSRERKAERKGR